MRYLKDYRNKYDDELKRDRNFWVNLWFHGENKSPLSCVGDVVKDVERK